MSRHETTLILTSLPSRVSDSAVARLQDRIGYAFQRPELLERALTHASCSVKNGGNNERLEFLGDAVVGLCVGQALYERFPDYDEGALTGLKSSLVCTGCLAKAAEELGLRDVGRLGKGLPADQPLPRRVYANLFEAVAGAIYLDGGLPAARAFIFRLLDPKIPELAACGGEPNPKAALQQEAQRRWSCMPRYRLLKTYGPDHGKTFEVCALLGKYNFPSAHGRTKKEAEQKSAQKALEVLQAAGCLGDEVKPLPSKEAE